MEKSNVLEKAIKATTIRWRKLATLFVVGLLALNAGATNSVTIDSVVQRWPWNNKVDITYTVSGGQNVAAGVYCRLVFTATIDGSQYVIDGVTNIGASASSGTHTVVWNPPSGIRADNCSMYATLYSADVPSGDDYLIVDLSSGEVAYEGLYASQADSNARYNTSSYKTTKMAFRKIAAGGGYPTGDSVNYATTNSATTWTTDRDYYIGVFPVTQAQYRNMGFGNPSYKYAVGAYDVSNPADHRPLEGVSWDTVRGDGESVPTNRLPATTSSSTGTFLQRLNFLTGNVFDFDLPTEVMFEMAERAGSTSTFYWGTAADSSYAVCKDDNDNPDNTTLPVGSRTPNALGLYDMAGNVWEWCLDDSSLANMANASDPWTPACGSVSNNSRRKRGGHCFFAPINYAGFRASYRNDTDRGTRNQDTGFRVAFVVK